MLANNYQSCICFFSFSEKKQKISWNIGIFFYKDDVPHGKHSGKPKKSWKVVMKWKGSHDGFYNLTDKQRQRLTDMTDKHTKTDRHSLSVSFCNTVISDKRTVFYPGYNIIVNGYNQCTKNIRIYSKILLWILIFILVILKAEYYLKIGIFLYKYFQKLSLEFELNMSCGWGVVVHRNGPGVETPRCPITMD